MEESHKEFKIKEDFFEIIVEILQKSLSEMKVDGGTTREITMLFDPNFAQKFGTNLPIFEKIGGEKAIIDIVAKFYNKVLVDPRIKEYFKNIDISK